MLHRQTLNWHKTRGQSIITTHQPTCTFLPNRRLSRAITQQLNGDLSSAVAVAVDGRRGRSWGLLVANNVQFQLVCDLITRAWLDPRRTNEPSFTAIVQSSSSGLTSVHSQAPVPSLPTTRIQYPCLICQPCSTHSAVHTAATRLIKDPRGRNCRRIYS